MTEEGMTRARRGKSRVLIVEDDRDLCGLLEAEITEAGFRARGVGTAEEAVDLGTRWSPDLVISDLRLPGADGLELLQRMRTLPDPPSFIVITAFGTVPQAVECLKAGADDFLTKPLDLDHLRLSVERALERRRLRWEVRRYREALDDTGFHGMIGRSEPMRHLFDQIRRLARADGPVLITGASGAGKELVARAIHAESSRADRDFVPVNCAGVPKDLMESEFFGHTAGAFTGASRARRGLFEEADGGTLLLDEISEMPGALQAKLLRVLQDGVVRPVGGNRGREVNVRVLAATNRDLESEMREGRFREDLFYRLETFHVRVPLLRERGDDLEMLAAHFLRGFAARLDRDIRGFTPEAARALSEYEFPGNVRELENAIERAVTFCDGRRIRPEHLSPRILDREGSGGEAGRGAPAEAGDALLGNGDRMPTLEQLERRYIRHVLERLDGNKRRAASVLGISRRTLYRRLEDGPQGSVSSDSTGD